MRQDPAGSRLTAPRREPRIAVGIIYPVGSLYVTNRTGIANVPGTVLHGALEDVAAVGRELSPLEARSTVGSFQFSVVDVAGALTDGLRAQLVGGEGVGRREVRVYTGDTDDFTDGTWSLVDTFVVDDVVAFDRGSYRFSCSDRQRELRDRIFPARKTRLVADVTATDTTISVSSLDGFELVPHTASFTDAPSASVVYARIKKTGEVFRATGFGSPASFTGVTRGVFGTVAQAIDVDPAAEVDKQPEIELVYYLEMPAPQLAYALMTGRVLDSGSPLLTLPDDYHLGIDPSLVDDALFRGIGVDLYDPADLTAGLVLSFSSTRGLRETDGKKFIEEQVLFPCWCFLPISAEGVIGLRRLTRLLGDARYSDVLYADTVVEHGALEHRVGDVANRVIFNWNHDGEDFTRRELFENAGSISAHGIGQTLEYDLLGVVVQRHTRHTLRGLFDSLTDRYGSPPQQLEAELMPSRNRIEVGDCALAYLTAVRDFAGDDTLYRAMEVESKTWNPRTGEVRVTLFGSTSRVDPDEPTNADVPPLADAWYSSEGTALSSVLTIVANHVTADGALTGADDLRDAVYYHLGDLTIDTGKTVTWTKNVQLRVRGTLTVNGKLDGRGRGISAVADPNTVGLALVQPLHPAEQTTLGSTWGSSGLLYLAGQHAAFLSPHAIGVAAVPRYAISVESGALLGMPSDLRGTPGYYGSGALEGGTFTVRAKGGAGGASGAGLAVVCRGTIAFGASGQIDVSGADGSAPASSVSLGGHTVYGGAGGGGAPGGLLVLLDGPDALLPDLTDGLVATHGATPQTGNGVRVAPPDAPSDPWTGYDPGIGTADLWGSSFQVQWVPAEVTAEASDDEVVPAPTGLAATADGSGVLLSWAPPPDDRYDVVEVWESTTNDRTGAVKLTERHASSAFVSKATSVTRYYWVRARFAPIGYSAWHPAGATSGVSATFGGAVGPAGEDAVSVAISTNNGAQWLQLPDFSWFPSTSTTDVTFTFKQGASTIATRVVRVTRSGNALTAALQSSSGATTSHSVVGSGTASITVTATETASGISANQVVSLQQLAARNTGSVLFEDTFEYASMADFLANWEDAGSGGGGTDSFPAQGENGGKVYEGAGAQRWYASKYNIPYDATEGSEYRIEIKVRMTTAPADSSKARICCGLVGVAADGTTLINVSGANSHGSQHYVAAQNYDMGAVTLSAWTNRAGFVRSTSASPTAPANDPAAPSTMYTGVRYVRPMFILNYPSGDGTMQVDYVRLTKLPSQAGITPDLPSWTIDLSANMDRIGKSIFKVSSASAWDGDFQSRESYGACAISFSPAQTNKALMVGLTSSPSGAGYTSIGLALYCRADAVLEVYSLGTSQGTVGTYAAGDALQVSYDGQHVRAIKNGTVLGTYAAANIRVFADSSFYDVGARIDNVTFTQLDSGGVVNLLSAVISNLAAIKAELGSAVISTSGYLRSGQTAYDTGDGWFIGYESGEPRFSMRQGSNYFRFRPSVGYPEFYGVAQFINVAQSFTPSWSGFTSAPTGDWKYLDFGKYVVMWMDATGFALGTSNASTMSFSNLPSAIRPSSIVVASCAVVDNVGNSFADVSIATDGNVYFFPHVIGGAAGTWPGSASAIVSSGGSLRGFTSSGTKGVQQGAIIVYPKI